MATCESWLRSLASIPDETVVSTMQQVGNNYCLPEQLTMLFDWASLEHLASDIEVAIREHIIAASESHEGDSTTTDILDLYGLRVACHMFHDKLFEHATLVMVGHYSSLKGSIHTHLRSRLYQWCSGTWTIMRAYSLRGPHQDGFRLLMLRSPYALALWKLADVYPDLWDVHNEVFPAVLPTHIWQVWNVYSMYRRAIRDSRTSYVIQQLCRVGRNIPGVSEADMTMNAIKDRVVKMAACESAVHAEPIW